jgi:hypothetical protein
MTVQLYGCCDAGRLAAWLLVCGLLLLGGRRGRVLVDATGDKAVCTACETSEAPESGCVSSAPVHGIANGSNGMWSLVASAEEAEDDELRCRDRRRCASGAHEY